MRETYKYRIYPKKSQISRLENIFSMCRTLYNNALEHRIICFNYFGKHINYYDQSAGLPEIKKLFPWYGTIYSQVLQNVLKRVDVSFQNFFRRIKDKGIPNSEKGFPKFKKRGQWNSITYPEGNIKIENNIINIPKIGKIDIILHRNIPSNTIIKTASIVKEGNNWYVSFSVEFNNHKPTEPNVDITKIIGIDVGLIDFYYDSLGNSKKAPRILRIAEKNLKRLYRKLSSCKKRSLEYYKVLKALKTSYQKVKNKRLDFLYKTAHSLFADTNIIVREDIQLKNLMKKPQARLSEDGKTFLPNGAKFKSGISKSFGDASFGKFFEILEHVAQKLNKLVIKVNPSYTSQDCSQCGARIQKSLSTRTHVCNNCGLVLNRDHNASLNILRLGIQSLGTQ